MLRQISWQAYWTAVLLLTAVYYVAVYLLYYRGVWQTFRSGKKSDHFNLWNREPVAPSFAIEEQRTEACLDELTAFFDAQKAGKPVKKELLYGLGRIIQKYPSLASASYQELLCNLIRIRLEDLGSIHLSEEEIKLLWCDG